jgi:hypothetical protein
VQSFDERHALDPPQREQTISIGARTERERLGYRDPGALHPHQHAPLALCRRVAEPCFRPLAQRVATRPDAELLHDDVAVRAANAKHRAAHVVVKALRFAGDELALDLRLERSVAPRPAQRRHRAIRA